MSKRNNMNVADQVDLISANWEKFAAEAKFAGMTLTDFRLATQGAPAAKAALVDLHHAKRGAIATRLEAYATAKPFAKRVVHAILADAQFGENSALYRALEYVSANERRKPGRKAAADPAAEKAPASPTPTA